MGDFITWLEGAGLRERLEVLDIQGAFEVMSSRVAAARAAGARDPLRAVTSRAAGPHSRAVTHRMLEQLGYSVQQRRIVHRLMAGSAGTPGRWPGLIRLYIEGAELTPEQRRYVLRHVRTFIALSSPRSGAA